ncbi:MAG TPA: YIP1 family protein [Myxococcaceae bacterium]|nr:YIP1 family protein [Myxococcaceae bacterium]
MDARCPRCSTVFTTDRSGIQFCPNCGQQVDVPEPTQASGGGWGQPPGPGPGGGGGFGGGRFTGEPPPGGTPLPGQRELTPWERRKELGLVTGFVETWKRSVLSPQAFFPTVRPDVPWSEALYFAWIIHAITVLLGLPFIGLGLLRPSMPSNFGADTAQMETMMRAMSGGLGIAYAVGTLLLYPLVVLAVAGVVHLGAMLFGAAKNGYGATVRALCYAQGPAVFGGLPCFGFLAWIYSVVLDVLGISSLQETSTGKAAGIVLLPMVIVFCCCSALVALFAAAIAGLISSMAGSGGTSL